MTPEDAGRLYKELASEDAGRRFQKELAHQEQIEEMLRPYWKEGMTYKEARAAYCAANPPRDFDLKRSVLPG
jgi:hypothetical protein